MKHSLECPRCAGRKIWNLRNAKEHSATGPAPLGAPQGLAPMETFLCAACCYSQWYTEQPSALQPDPGAAVVDLNDHRLRCADCDSREHLLAARFVEAGDRHRWPKAEWRGNELVWHAQVETLPLAVLYEREVARGSFAVVACRSCGLLSWFACDIRDLPSSVERDCARCGAAPLGRVPRVEEVGGHRLPIAWRGRREIGHFHLDVCTACGFTDWFAERFIFERLVADGREVLLLEGQRPRTPPPRDRNPYR
jgi:hypothetical protein